MLRDSEPLVFLPLKISPRPQIFPAENVLGALSYSKSLASIPSSFHHFSHGETRPEELMAQLGKVF